MTVNVTSFGTLRVSSKIESRHPRAPDVIAELESGKSMILLRIPTADYDYYDIHMPPNTADAVLAALTNIVTPAHANRIANEEAEELEDV